MTTPRQLRAVRLVPDNASDPITVEDAKDTGDKIAQDLQKLIITALNTGMRIGAAGAFANTWNTFTIRALRHEARASIKAWREVEASCDELLRLASRLEVKQ